MGGVLVTGFEPFGGEVTNPSWEAVRLLPDEIHGVTVRKLEVPVIFGLSARVVLGAMREMCPDIVVCVGQAAGRAGLTVERVAINVADSTASDNDGVTPTDELLVQGAPAAYLATLPLKASVRVGLDQKIMVAVQGYWSAVGVNLTVNTSDAGVWASDWAAGNLQITALAWFPLYADADNHMYTYFYSANAAKKSSFYNSPEFDALVTKARQSTDESERADLYKQADNLLTRTDYATLPLYYPKYQFVAKDYVENAKVGNLIYHMMDIDIDTTKSDYTGEE